MRLPREHGAWAMLYVPMVAGLLVAGRFSWSVLLLVLASSLFFIAREPFLAWRRARWRGRKAEGAAQAFLIYAGLAAALGLSLVLGYRLYLLIPIGLAALVLVLVNAEQSIRRTDRTIKNELLAISGLTSTAAAAHYTGVGQFEPAALWLWALCALYFASSVFYVRLRVDSAHAGKARDRGRALTRCLAYHAVLLLLLTVIVIDGRVSPLVLVAFVPVIGRGLWHVIKPARQLSLKRIGVMEIVYSIIFTVFVTFTLRAAG